MLPEPRVPMDDAVRDALCSTTARLETLWEEATVAGRSSPAVSLERRRWDCAARRLVDAMEAVEHFAGSVEPSIGRRDWRLRCAGGGASILR